MYLIAIAWLYVALMMGVAEAAHPDGSLIGAVFTFLLYGLAPVGLVIYLLGGRFRRQARERAARPGVEGADDGPGTSPLTQPDGRGHASGDAIAPERKEP